VQTLGRILPRTRGKILHLVRTPRLGQQTGPAPGPPIMGYFSDLVIQ
jgi:hypothetical protein